MTTTPQPPTEARELKACPFCGGSMQMGIFKAGLGVDQRTFYYANCSFDDCGCELNGKPTEAEARAVCNHRTTPTAREVLEELELALKENLAKWDKPLLYLHEIHKSIEIILASYKNNKPEGENEKS